MGAGTTVIVAYVDNTAVGIIVIGGAGRTAVEVDIGDSISIGARVSTSRASPFALVDHFYTTTTGSSNDAPAGVCGIFSVASRV